MTFQGSPREGTDEPKSENSKVLLKASELKTLTQKQVGRVLQALPRCKEMGERSLSTIMTYGKQKKDLERSQSVGAELGDRRIPLGVEQELDFGRWVEERQRHEAILDCV